MGPESALLELNLSGNKIAVDVAAQSVAAMRDSGKLQVLRAASCGLTDKFATDVALAMESGRLPLLELDLSYNAISSKGLERITTSLRNTASMRVLKLNGTSVRSSAVAALMDCVATLGVPTHVELCHTKLNKKLAERIASILSTRIPYSKLTALGLADCRLDKSGCFSIVHALRNNDVLEVLSIGGNGFDRAAIDALRESMCRNKRIRELSLENSNIGADGVRVLADIVKNNTPLQKLDASQCNIDVAGVKVLCECLAFNYNLETLVLSANPRLGVEGARILSMMYLTNGNRTLTNLVLDDCAISDEGALAVASIMNSATCVLVHLSLDGNQIGNRGAIAILDGQLQATALMYLSLIRNSIIRDTQIEAVVHRNLWNCRGVLRIHLDSRLPSESRAAAV